ncbi:MAG: DUF6427 family protein [Bacteroidota bacterium]|nr:DUF6427 family protein [Bacteroidota bacterium]MDP3144273.1 DUF6427 family protein [Bacteroidota bacterium]MDP3558328.1 DUF6427 family protein [Bacteroidota bacterium]
MFAGLLNKGVRGSLVLLSVVFVISAIALYFAPKSLEFNNYPNVFYNYFSQKITNRAFILLLNFLFVGLGVVLVSLISVKQEVVDKLNYFPVFIFLLLSIVCVNPNQLTPQIITNVFVLYSIYKLLDTYRKENVLSQLFEAAFWLSISAYITISSVISFPLFFIILLVLRPFYWRDWAIAILGFLAPILICESIAYLSDFSQWYLFKSIGLFLQFLKSPSFSEYFLPLVCFLVITLLISIFQSLSRGFGNTVKKQKTKTILFWFLFFSTFGFFASGANSSSIILTYAFPLSFFIGDFLFGMKQTKIANTLLTFFLLCLLVVFLGEFDLI